MTFESLGLLKSLVQAVAAKGYTQPTPIQRKVIPAVLSGGDIMACAQTGTGKTAGFTLPLLQQLSTKPAAKNQHALALVLTPTRELAAQVHESIMAYGKFLNLRSAVVFGGVSITPQMRKLSRGVEILVATPGRLLDLHQQKAFNFSQVETLVLDEADRMLDMGFIPDITRILALLPKKRQNLLFSATFSSSIRQLAKGLLHKPIEINVEAATPTVDIIEQCAYYIDQKQKPALLIHLIQNHNWYQALVFTRTKYGANRLVETLAKANISATAIHGNKTQAQRTKALQSFKDGAVQILVATDIASRGIDIDKLPHVINFDVPGAAEDYLHRIGRTGRAGAEGQAITFVSSDETAQLRDIERTIKQTLKREKAEGFVLSAASEMISDAKPKSMPNKPKSGAGKKSGDNRAGSHKASASKTSGQHKTGGRKATGTKASHIKSAKGKTYGSKPAATGGFKPKQAAKKRPGNNPSRRRTFS
jgi:ATP-dependent RNA helicase RhlE